MKYIKKLSAVCLTSLLIVNTFSFADNLTNQITLDSSVNSDNLGNLGNLGNLIAPMEKNLTPLYPYNNLLKTTRPTGLPKLTQTHAMNNQSSKGFVEDSNANSESAKLTSLRSKMNSNVLYVVERDGYEKAVKKNSLLIKTKNNLLVIDSENVSDLELEVMNSADSCFLVGNFKKEIQGIESLKGHLYFKNDASILKLDENFEDKNIAIVNGENLVDLMNAMQISNAEKRTIVLLRDGNLEAQSKIFLKKYGEFKNIIFIEGEYKIPEETKQYVMRMAGSPKYEIDRYKITKQTPTSEANLDLLAVPGKIIEKVNLTIEENVTNMEKPSEAAPVNLVENKETELSNVLSYANTTYKDQLSKLTKQSEDNLISKTKVIELNDGLAYPEEYLDGELTYKFIKNLMKENNPDLEITKNKEIKGHEDEALLKVSYAAPLEMQSYTSVNKEVYVTPKSTSIDVLYSVMEGDYGVGAERKEKLEKEGYSYEEVQEEISKILELRKSEIRLDLEGDVADTPSMLINAFLTEALKMKGWTYSQPLRWEEGYADCSSIIIRALINTGYTNNHSNMTTHTISNDPRFFEIPITKIQKGDILWYPGHVEIYMGGDTTYGAFRPGKVAGYANGVYRFSRAFRLSGN